jgi:hypothetical protein
VLMVYVVSVAIVVVNSLVHVLVLMPFAEV